VFLKPGLALAAHTLADCRHLAELALGADDAARARALVRDDPPVR
jgi:hypothetical protein